MELKEMLRNPVMEAFMNDMKNGVESRKGKALPALGIGAMAFLAYYILPLQGF